MKLTKPQIDAIKQLQKYPNDMIMFNGYLTGGHGVKINLNTVNSLKRLGLIEYGRLTDKGNNII